ncbi:uncharacterized protein BJ212DRAFT_1446955 [Suillus subaureus]|uniref:Uncharacterized protein n=1 Tax=Suillus subaureus TaxID=48587 RepID=A0A9P7EAV4_9AGAM|nr:uncharacterized protein BJ212DRAFT_1446955 [Suillus subaureus]KAG1816441.1 hypothetical protein BJ212DRAFT_1446955 [Suillus subaureus]
MALNCPFTNDFPQVDIHELLSLDILHQIIKGTFKDHLVDWVGEYLLVTHGTHHAAEIMDGIDCRCEALTEDDLVKLQDALDCFHQHQEIFKTTGVVSTFSLSFKEPWCQSSRFNALRQMLLTNQCLDKLAATRVDFEAHGMLRGSCLSNALGELWRCM